MNPSKGLSGVENAGHGTAERGDAPGTAVATLGGGCFWCVEAVFADVIGVTGIKPGYAGGETADPTYEQVCTGTTGHAEVVQLTFDPEQITYEEILNIFFATHDPTTLNRQGNDIGTQYRSVIYYHDDEQRQAAEDVVAQVTADNVYDDPIVTELSPAPKFYTAEEYHHQYFKRNPFQGYCQAVIAPKVADFRKRFAHKLKA